MHKKPMMSIIPPAVFATESVHSLSTESAVFFFWWHSFGGYIYNWRDLTTCMDIYIHIKSQDIPRRSNG